MWVLLAMRGRSRQEEQAAGRQDLASHWCNWPRSILTTLFC